MVALSEIVEFLDQHLPPYHCSDASFNGLQVENNGFIERVYLAVDASVDIFNKTPSPDNALFIVHHGLFWRKQDVRIVGPLGQKVKFLMQHNAALYASHLPLDIHPEFGNNAQMLQLLGIQKEKFQPFGSYHGSPIGLWADFEEDQSMAHILEKVSSFSPIPFQFLRGKKTAIKRVAVITGGGCDFVNEAQQINADLFITGEFSLQSYTYSKEVGINVLYLTHYGSEKWGVIKFGELIKKSFSLDCVFLDACPLTTWINVS